MYFMLQFSLVKFIQYSSVKFSF